MVVIRLKYSKDNEPINVIHWLIDFLGVELFSCGVVWLKVILGSKARSEDTSRSWGGDKEYYCPAIE